MKLDLSSEEIFYVAVGGLSLALLLMIFILGSVKPVEPPTLGPRGYWRHRAREGSSLFREFEGVICFIAGWFACLPMRARRIEVEQKLTSAGDFMGMTADELHALAFVSMVLGTAMAALALLTSGLPLFSIAFFAMIGWYAPFSHVETVAADRKRNINRVLPTIVEMLALGMSAGLDFPGSLRRVSAAQPEREAIRDELQRILRDLDLGHTRSRALRSFAARVPTDEVTDFVAAVLQAEAKGNPLREVLHIQAGMLRMRRSMRAEELASRSAILLVAPLALLLISILMLVAGPMMINASRSL